MESGTAVVPEAWSRFLEYAARARAKPTFDAEERDHRLELAKNLRRLLAETPEEGGGAWAFDDAVLAPAGPPYFLIPPTARDWLTRWSLSDGASLRHALAHFLEKDLSPEARFASFVDAAAHAGGQGGVEAQPNLVLAVGSLFNFALAPNELPIMRNQDFKFARRLRNGGPKGSSAPSGTYEDNLAFARVVQAEMNAAGIPVRDMLDVQSLIVVCSQERELWMPKSAEGDGERARAESGQSERRNDVYLSLCACLGYDAPYLEEWIEFHRLAGVERFLLYNNGDRAAQADLLAPYIEEGIVVLHDWPTFPPMIPAFDHCLEHHGEQSRWIAFIDTDEFLFSPTGRTLPELLVDYERWPAVAANSMVFGSSGHETKPPGLVIESYIDRSSDSWVNLFIKSIVDPSRTARCLGPHHFEYRHGLAMDENHYAIRGQLTKSVSVSRLRLNHYHTKSKEEFERKLATRLPSDLVAGRRTRAGWLEERGTERDETILAFLPSLRAALARSPRLPDPAGSN